MTFTVTDPPEDLIKAEETFKVFLVQNGYPCKVQWVLAQDILVEKSGRYLVRHHVTNVDGTMEANRRYSLGLERKTGISLRAYCASETETFASIYIPSDELDAHYRLIGPCLKLTCPTNVVPAHIIKNTTRWLLHSFRNRSRTRLLDEL